MSERREQAKRANKRLRERGANAYQAAHARAPEFAPVAAVVALVRHAAREHRKQQTVERVQHRQAHQHHKHDSSHMQPAFDKEMMVRGFKEVLYMNVLVLLLLECDSD